MPLGNQGYFFALFLPNYGTPSYGWRSFGWSSYRNDTYCAVAHVVFVAHVSFVV